MGGSEEGFGKARPDRPAFGADSRLAKKGVKRSSGGDDPGVSSGTISGKHPKSNKSSYDPEGSGPMRGQAAQLELMLALATGNRHGHAMGARETLLGDEHGGRGERVPAQLEAGFGAGLDPYVLTDEEDAPDVEIDPGSDADDLLDPGRGGPRAL